MTETTWTPATIALSKLKPWERNPKRISKAHAARLLDLWERLGQFQTIAIGPDGEVYDGHQRLSVLKAKHGGSYQVQVLQASRPLTEAEREELTIAAHSGTTGSWDWDALAGWDVGNLTAWGLDEELLSDWNAGATALREMLAAEAAPTGEDPGPQVDKAEELRAKWGVEPGQLWQLGEHRLICGDCTDRATVERVMGGERARLVVSDPPYNVAYSSRGSNKDSWGEIENDDMSEEEFYGWLLLVGAAFDYAMASGASIYLCHGDTDRKAVPFIDLFGDMKWKRSATIIWAKQAASMGWQDYRSQHECLSYGWKEGDKHYFTADRSQTTVWEISRDAQAKYQHPTQKPVELFEKAISNSSEAGNVVVDFFLGSGTTLIACERLGRRCRAVEISPGYVAVALERWATMTGQTPALLDGAP